MCVNCRERNINRNVLQLESGLTGGIVEHLDGFQRILVESLAHDVQLLKDVGSYGYDVTANILGLENGEELTRARPDQFDGRTGYGSLHGRSHDGNRIPAGIRNT